MRRALLAIACLCLAPIGAWAADVPVPAPNPFGTNEPDVLLAPLAEEIARCAEGEVIVSAALLAVEHQLRESGEAGMVVAGPMAARMRAALGVVLEQPIAPASLIVVLPVRGPDGATGQLWVLVEGPCSPAVAVLPPPVAAAVWKQVGNIV